MESKPRIRYVLDSESPYLRIEVTLEEISYGLQQSITAVDDSISDELFLKLLLGIV